MKKTVYILYALLFLVLVVLLVVGIIRYSSRDKEPGWQPDSVQQDTTTEETELSEEALLKVADDYELQGDFQAQREALIALHRRYPSREYVERISRIAVSKDASDAQTAGLMERLTEGLSKGDAAGLRELVGSQEWERQMRDDLAGVQRKTEFTGERTIQVASDAYTTTAAAETEDGSYWYFAVDADGMIIAETGYADGVYQGGCRISYFDRSNELIRDFTGTFQENICVGEFSVTYDGVVYSGKLKEDGTTAEEQIDEVSEEGNVIYAYAEDGSYLYEPDASEESFVIGREYLGLPEKLVW